MNKLLIGGAVAAAFLTAGTAMATTETPQPAPAAQPAHAGRHARVAQPVTRAAIQSIVDHTRGGTKTPARPLSMPDEDHQG